MEKKYIFSSSFNSQNTSSYSDLIMYYCDMQQCAPHHYWSGIRDHFLIHYVLSGKGTFRSGDTTYRLEKGHGFLITPGELSFYQADAKDPWKYCWFGFHGLKAELFLKQVALSSNNPVFFYDSDDFFENCIAQMIEAKNRSAGSAFFLTAQMHLFFARLAEISTLPRPVDKSDNVQELYIKKAIDYIEKNYSRKIGIAEIASFIGINRKYLFSLFKEQLHFSPQAFLIDYRMRKASDLLRNPSLSIRDVAHSVGYEDPLLFSKMFKKSKGASPREYRHYENMKDVPEP